jgi:polyferredoxin
MLFADNALLTLRRLRGALFEVRSPPVFRNAIMPRVLKIILAFVAGLIVGWAIPIAWYIVATNYFGLHDRDGGGAMGAIFIMGPIAGMLLGIVVAIVTIRRTA